MLMADVIATVTTVFTAAVGWVGTVATTITAQPLLLIGFAVPLIGTGIVMFKKMMG